MKNKLSLTMFGKPISKKNRMKYGRGKVYKDKTTSDFENLMQERYAFTKDTWEEINRCQWRTDKSYILRLDLTFGDRRGRDLQNYFDVICDCMEGIWLDNDKQIKEIHATKTYDKGMWKYKIQLEEI